MMPQTGRSQISRGKHAESGSRQNVNITAAQQQQEPIHPTLADNIMSSRGWCRPVDDWLSTIHDTLVWWTGGAGGHDFSASANGMLEQFLHPVFLCSISVGPCVRAVCPRLCMEYKQHVAQQEKVPLCILQMRAEAFNLQERQQLVDNRRRFSRQDVRQLMCWRC